VVDVDYSQSDLRLPFLDDAGLQMGLQHADAAIQLPCAEDQRGVSGCDHTSEHCMGGMRRTPPSWASAALSVCS